MDNIDREKDQERFDRIPAESKEQADLKRAIHKIAWSRMLGKNDDLNPFAEGGYPPQMGQREQ